MIRCKFKCDSKTQQKAWANGSGAEFFYDYKFSAVTGGSDENKGFYAASPCGSFNVQTVLTDAFVPGQEYYFDISPAVVAA